MKDEIEVKFADVNHDALRFLLKKAGAVMTHANRKMRRVVIHTDEMSSKNAFVRIRDEGHRITVTYKQFDTDSIDGAKENEIIVSDFDETVSLFKSAGLVYDVFQESWRENWELNGVEIMLDEWPWLKTYIEIEGPSENAVRSAANTLGFKWTDAQFGGVANLYKAQYPHIGDEGLDIINHDWKSIRFDDPKPELIS